jgi:hypothetical protein
MVSAMLVLAAIVALTVLVGLVIGGIWLWRRER